MRLVITGIGVLSSAGIGKEAFRSSLFSDACAPPSRVGRFTREISGFEVKGLDFESRFEDAGSVALIDCHLVPAKEQSRSRPPAVLTVCPQVKLR